MDGLEQYGCELIRKINTFESQRNSEEISQEPDELRNLKGQYNSIINQMEEANPSPLGDPLEKLPLELWQIIIREFCFDWRNQRPSSRDLDQLFILTLVSKKWSGVILSTLILWSEIVVYWNIKD